MRILAGYSAALLFGVSWNALAADINRSRDPVVIEAVRARRLLGAAPQEVVAYRFARGAWQPVPVQVDEKVELDLARVRRWAYNSPARVRDTVYADPNTWTGADPDPLLDADDDIVLLAGDADGQAPRGAEPGGVVPGSGVEVCLSDPLNKGYRRYLYLFRRTADAASPAFTPEVQYRFRLKSGEFLKTYRNPGANPEDSWVETPGYRCHFSDRWVLDALHLLEPNRAGPNLLDRHRRQFHPERPSPNEETWSHNGGAFIANRSGPVRALRSVVGAASGTFVAGNAFFYPGRAEFVQILRVHGIGGVVDFWNYSREAVGMRYCNNLNPEGVLIDGQPDEVKAGPLQWELLTGKHGSFVISHRLETTIPGFAPTSFYQDDRARNRYGASGLWINQKIPSTDPCRPEPDGKWYKLSWVRTVQFAGPDLTAEQAAQLDRQTRQPLVAELAEWGATAPK
jgi:hypothetical protein